jgi:hypothetical protein
MLAPITMAYCDLGLSVLVFEFCSGWISTDFVSGQYVWIMSGVSRGRELVDVLAIETCISQSHDQWNSGTEGAPFSGAFLARILISHSDAVWQSSYYQWYEEFGLCTAANAAPMSLG